MDVYNPATGQQIASYEEFTDEETAETIALADERYNQWRDRKLQEREGLLKDAAAVLRKDKQRYAKLMTREMGKPISQSVA